MDLLYLLERAGAVGLRDVLISCIWLAVGSLLVGEKLHRREVLYVSRRSHGVAVRLCDVGILFYPCGTCKMKPRKCTVRRPGTSREAATATGQHHGTT